MENSVYYNEHEHNHNIDVTTGESTLTSTSHGEYNRSREVQNEDRTSTNSRATASQLSSLTTVSRGAPLRTRGENHGRRRRNPLNSGLWISVELLADASQIVAAVVVLSLSIHEHPQAPLFAWIIGYTIGCVAILPRLCWRYIHRNNQTSVQESAQTHQRFSGDRYTDSIARGMEGSVSRGNTAVSQLGQNILVSNSRLHRLSALIDLYKMALECFFAAWFVVGNVWVFGGHSSAADAPNLYRLCIAFLTFSCVGYAMRLILCATICCCFPSTISVLGFRVDLPLTRGTTSKLINALPTYKIKSARSQNQESSQTIDGNFEGGILAAGTDKERIVSPEDAVSMAGTTSNPRRSTSKRPAALKCTYPGIESAWISVSCNVLFDMETQPHIYSFFKAAGLLPLLSGVTPFSSVLVRQFYNNLKEPSKSDSHAWVDSTIQGHPVTITHDDVRSVYGLMEHGHKLDIMEKLQDLHDWTRINEVLHNKEYTKEFISTVSTMHPYALVIQDILRHTIMFEAGDTEIITAQLSLVTYYIMDHIPFDIAYFLLSLMQHTYRLKSPSRRRRPNTLPLGGVIQLILFSKYPYIVPDEYPIDRHPREYIPDEYHDLCFAQPSHSASGRQLRRRGLVRGTQPEFLDVVRSQDETLQVESQELQALCQSNERLQKKMSNMKKILRYMMHKLLMLPTPLEELSWRDTDDENSPGKPLHYTRRSPGDSNKRE